MNINGNNQEAFFVRGYWKSGTTWLEKLINTHPQISLRGEYHWEPLTKAMIGLRNIPHAISTARPFLDDLLENKLLETITEVMMAYEKSIGEKNFDDVRLFGDKTPEPINPLIFKKSKHICILRDGRDVLISSIFHIFNKNIQDAMNTFPKLKEKRELFIQNKNYFTENPSELLEGLEDFVTVAGKNWANNVKINYHRYHQSKNGDIETPIFFLTYEQLHAHTQEKLHQIFEFLGVDKSLAPPVQGDLSAGFKKEDPKSFFRKGITGDWKNYFNTKAALNFAAVAQPQLELLELESNAMWVNI